MPRGLPLEDFPQKMAEQRCRCAPEPSSPLQNQAIRGPPHGQTVQVGGRGRGSGPRPRFRRLSHSNRCVTPSVPRPRSAGGYPCADPARRGTKHGQGRLPPCTGSVGRRRSVWEDRDLVLHIREAPDDKIFPKAAEHYDFNAFCKEAIDRVRPVSACRRPELMEAGAVKMYDVWDSKALCDASQNGFAISAAAGGEIDVEDIDLAATLGGTKLVNRPREG